MIKLWGPIKRGNVKTTILNVSFNNDKVKWFPLTKEYKDEFMIKYRFPKTKLHAPPIQLLKLDLCKTFVNIKRCSVHVYNVHKQYNFTHSFCSWDV